MQCPKDETQPIIPQLVVCPDCSKETATSFMVHLEDKNDKKKSRSVCMLCFDTHQRQHTKVFVDRTPIETSSVHKKKLAGRTWKLVVICTLCFVLLCTVIYHLVDHFEKKKHKQQQAELAKAADADGDKTDAKDGDSIAQNPDDPNGGLSKEKAEETPEDVSGVAARNAHKMMAAVAARIGEVASRFSPKTDITGPIKKVTPRRSFGDAKAVDPKGGTDEDALDQLIMEANAADVAAGRPGIKPLKEGSLPARRAKRDIPGKAPGDMVISSTGKKPVPGPGGLTASGRPGGSNPGGPGGSKSAGPPQTSLNLQQPIILKKVAANPKERVDGIQPIVGSSRTAPNTSQQPIIVAKATSKSPVVAAATQQTLNNYVFFEFESANVGDADDLADVLGILKNHPDAPVFVQGYVDSTEKGGPVLSQKRAEAVCEVLSRKLGFRVRNLTAVGEGTLSAADVTPEAQALNRRVRISVPNLAEVKQL